MNFVVLANKVKIKESEKIDKYLDLAWELKKLWSMTVTVTVILIVIDPWNFHKGFGKETGGGGDQRKNQNYLDYSTQLEYWEESWRSEGTWCHSDSSKNTQTEVGEKKLTWSKMIITISIQSAFFISFHWKSFQTSLSLTHTHTHTHTYIYITHGDSYSKGTQQRIKIPKYHAWNFKRMLLGELLVLRASILNMAKNITQKRQ